MSSVVCRLDENGVNGVEASRCTLTGAAQNYLLEAALGISTHFVCSAFKIFHGNVGLVEN